MDRYPSNSFADPVAPAGQLKSLAIKQIQKDDNNNNKKWINTKRTKNGRRGKSRLARQTGAAGGIYIQDRKPVVYYYDTDYLGHGLMMMLFFFLLFFLFLPIGRLARETQKKTKKNFFKYFPPPLSQTGLDYITPRKTEGSWLSRSIPSLSFF